MKKKKEIFHIKGNDMVITKQDGVVNNIETCDMFGWLIPKEKASDFEKIVKSNLYIALDYLFKLLRIIPNILIATI